MPSSGGASPFLDTYGQKCTVKTTSALARARAPSKVARQRHKWTRADRRAYQRILSGINAHYGERLRFLTLTMPVDAKRPLSGGFRAFKERVKRMTIGRLVREGWVPREKVGRYYPGRKLGDKLRFNYFKRETSEGNGVLHILYFGDFIPHMWIRATWLELTGAYEIDIRACKRDVYNAKRLAKYVVEQYVAGQSKAVRSSWSWWWVYPGFVSAWKGLVRFCSHHMRYGLSDAIRIWKKSLREGIRLGPDGFPVHGPRGPGGNAVKEFQKKKKFQKESKGQFALFGGSV